MHWQAYQYVATIAQLLPDYFVDKSILEVGSHSVNGSVRDLFYCDDYIGLDLSEGEGVDIVISGHEFKSNLKFDVCISCECFEHNPYYEETLNNMIEHAEKDGLIIFSCATEGRPEHGTSATDPSLSPGTSAINWDYYKNLYSHDFEGLGLSTRLSWHDFSTNSESCDLYFIGTKSEKFHSEIKAIGPTLKKSILFFEELSKDISISDKLLPLMTHLQLVPTLLFNIFRSTKDERFISNYYFQCQLRSAYIQWPTSSEVNYLMSKLYSLECNKAKSLLFAKKAASNLCCGDFFTHYYSTLLAEIGDFKRAIEVLSRIKEVNQKPPLLWTLAGYKQKGGDLDGANKSIDKALALKPKNAVFMYLKFQLLEKNDAPAAKEIGLDILNLDNAPQWITENILRVIDG